LTTRSSSTTDGRLGPVLVGTVAVANVVVWLVARPGGQPTGRFIGELCGAEAVLLFSCSLVLTSLLPGVEAAFGGLDRAVVWHRLAALAGLALLVPHVALITSAPDPFETTLGHGLGDLALLGLLTLIVWAVAPKLRGARWPGPIRALARTSFEHWLSAHRLTGLFVAVALAHAAIVDPVLHESGVLRAVFVIVGVIGIGAYLYRELVAPHVVPIYDYTVSSVRRLNRTTAELALSPRRKALTFVPGQFVVVGFGGLGGWEWHPFSVTSSASDERLEATIKAEGDYTQALVEDVRPGVPARIAGPFGGFDYRDGGYEQVWIAGGIGVAPFISWIRSLDGTLDRDIDFYYSVKTAADVVYREEIEAAAARYPSLRVQIVPSDTEGRLTADEVIGALRPAIEPWIYMCGPPAMNRALARGFRQLGVPASRIRWEHFDAR
jgi:predicted ferric reductase